MSSSPLFLDKETKVLKGSLTHPGGGGSSRSPLHLKLRTLSCPASPLAADLWDGGGSRLGLGVGPECVQPDGSSPGPRNSITEHAAIASCLKPSVEPLGREARSICVCLGGHILQNKHRSVSELSISCDCGHLFLSSNQGLTWRLADASRKEGLGGCFIRGSRCLPRASIPDLRMGPSAVTSSEVTGLEGSVGEVLSGYHCLHVPVGLSFRADVSCKLRDDRERKILP